MWPVPGDIHAAKVEVLKVKLLKGMNGFSHEPGLILSKPCGYKLFDSLSPPPFHMYAFLSSHQRPYSV